MSDAQPLRLHRILRTEQATEADFLSKAHLGIPCPSSDPEILGRWGGLSLFGSAEQARRVSRRLPMLGSYIAALEIPPGAAAQAKPTTGPGHYTLGGDPGGGTALAGQGAADMPDTSMMYEVWELASCSLIAAYPSELQAVDLVLLLLEDGWSPDDLVLAGENERLDVADLPPPLTGAALAERVADA
jgi:hypothetical protein